MNVCRWTAIERRKKRSREGTVNTRKRWKNTCDISLWVFRLLLNLHTNGNEIHRCVCSFKSKKKRPGKNKTNARATAFIIFTYGKLQLQTFNSSACCILVVDIGNCVQEFPNKSEGGERSWELGIRGTVIFCDFHESVIFTFLLYRFHDSV